MTVHPQTRKAYLAVGLGAALGAFGRAVLDFGFSLVWPDTAVGLLVVNVLGSALLALVLVWGERAYLPPHRFHHYWRPFAATGVLGGFTTTSAYAATVFSYLNQGEWLSGLGFLIASLALAFIAYRWCHDWAVRNLRVAS